MKKSPIKLESLVTVPENIIISAAEEIADDPDNSFIRVLGWAQEYKDAGCKPIYVLDRSNMDIFVCCEETFGKKLH